MNKVISKIAFLGIVITPIAGVLSCGGSSNKLDPAKKDSAIMMVGQVGHNDKGFLEGAYNGIQKAINLKMGLTKYREIKLADSSDSSSKQGTTSALLAGAYNIIGVGYQYPGFINSADYAGKYPERKFIAIDGKISGSVKKNVIAVDFNAEQSSFLAGVAACLFLAKNYATYSPDGGLKIGAFGGGAFGSVKDMLAGFIQGISYYNKNLAKNNDYKVKFIGWGTSEGAGFTGGFVPNSASLTIAKQLLAKKADVIFPVAGGQVSSVVDAIKLVSGSQTKIIGVDSDQNVIFGSDGNKFITSSMKNTEKAVLEALKAIYGETSSLTLGQNNNVGIDGDFVKIASGLISGDDFKGKHFATILKESQNLIDVTSDAKSIYEQLTDADNNILEQAENTKKSQVVWSSKIDNIWRATSDSVIEVDFS